MKTRLVKALIPVADGSEDIETVTLIDVLRRAGFEVTVASVMAGHEVRLARGTRLMADALLADCADHAPDLIALPGGMPGAAHLRDSALLATLLRRQLDAGRTVGAICAAPAVVLAHHGLLDEVPATCHPGFRQQLPHCEPDRRVVRSGNVITSQGPGTALEFALALVAALGGETLRDEVAAPMVVGG